MARELSYSVFSARLDELEKYVGRPSTYLLSSFIEWWGRVREVEQKIDKIKKSLYRVEYDEFELLLKSKMNAEQIYDFIALANYCVDKQDKFSYRFHCFLTFLDDCYRFKHEFEQDLKNNLETLTELGESKEKENHWLYYREEG